MKIKVYFRLPKDNTIDTKEYFGLSDDDWSELSETDKQILVDGWFRLRVSVVYEELNNGNR